MSVKNSAVTVGRALETRPNNSRKLLARKARERTLATVGSSVEDSFPSAAATLLVPALEGLETAITTRLDAKRHPKLIRPGDLSPNAGTVVAAIVRLVVERGELSMAELVDLMSGPAFDHPKARSAEKGWSQGYIAGAIRSGFLTVAAERSPVETRCASNKERPPC